MTEFNMKTLFRKTNKKCRTAKLNPCKIFDEGSSTILNPSKIFEFPEWAKPRNLIPVKIYPIKVTAWFQKVTFFLFLEISSAWVVANELLHFFPKSQPETLAVKLLRKKKDTLWINFTNVHTFYKNNFIRTIVKKRTT